jgi:type II secretory ATPase GspE/PulE/Tfp pilus assembly ATPase PilB-like protein
MGVEPYLVASVLEGVLAQRLGRRICRECREQAPIPEDVSHRIQAEELKMFQGRVWRGSGRGPKGQCDECNGSGYRGRVGYFELMIINSGLRRAISENRPVAQLTALAGADYRTMRQDGLERAAEGITTIEEVLRATQDAEE